MVQKRPHGEELYEVSFKQPRRLESIDEMVSSLEFPDKNVASNPRALGEFGEFAAKSKFEYDERLDGGNGAELRTCLEKELEASFPANISNSYWATSTTSEEDIKSKAPFHIVLSPDHHNLVHPARTVIHVGDIYSSLLEYPPLKPVPVGEDFQAEIPEWGLLGSKQKSIYPGETSEALNLPSESSKSDRLCDSEDENRLAGTCIIPMPKLDMPENNMKEIGAGRTNCSCEDEGSIRCVQQHITEARGKLRATLGQETFASLGFCDMGEVVTQKWSEEEELIFHEVVDHNPASLGNNFWNNLAIEFPSRSKKEIISYYFNVFMLRKRALQNRSDPLNIDSDNDEWEITNDSPGHDDDFSHDEFHGDVHDSRDHGFPKISIHDVYEYLGDNKVICNASQSFHVAAFDNHSIGPTFLPKDQVLSIGEFHNDTHESSRDDTSVPSGHGACDNIYQNMVISNVAKTFPAEAFDNHSTVPTLQPSGGFLANEPEDQTAKGDVRAGNASEEVPSEKANSRKHWTGSNGGHELLLELCSSKEWPKNEDFLPTCSMIEEVFGNEAWNDKNIDG